jgi:hypothetical protein
MPSVFNPESYLDASMSKPLEARPKLKTSDEVGLYDAVVGEVKAATWEKDGKSGLRFIVPVEIQTPQAQQADGVPAKITLTDSVFADLTESGMLDESKGKNNRLRMYREATDLNKPGDTFNVRMLQGRPIKVKLKHEVYNNAPQERIDSVLHA